MTWNWLNNDAFIASKFTYLSCDAARCQMLAMYLRVTSQASSQLPVVARLLSAHLYWHQCCYCVSISISVGGVSGGRGLVAYSALILFKLYNLVS